MASVREIQTILNGFAFVHISHETYSDKDGKDFRCDYAYYSEAGGWLKLHRVPTDWRDARLRCHLEGSKLASPLNAPLAAAMRSVMELNAVKRGVYTGISSFFSRGDFQSAEGIPLSKIPHTWAEGEPDNVNDEEGCLMMLESGELADIRCTETLPYLCYRKNQTTVLGDCGIADSEYKFDSRTGSCYKFHKVLRTWPRAYMACAAEGGHLAIINSETEAQVIKELFAKYPVRELLGNFWKNVAYIGFHDWDEHEEFLTIEGDTLEAAGYAKFAGGEPNNAREGEYCGAVYRSGLYNDLWCEKYAAIYEKRPDSLLCDDDQQQGPSPV